jgi:hypothetical protein
MGKKIALNVFYNLGIILSIFGITWGYNHNQYLPIALFVATGAFFVYLKIKLVKEMRSTLKNRN